MPDNKREVYDRLSSKFNIKGGFENFATAMDDEQRRRKFYDTVSQHMDVGDYDAFSTSLGYAKPEPVQAQAPVQGTIGKVKGRPAAGTIEPINGSIDGAPEMEPQSDSMSQIGRPKVGAEDYFQVAGDATDEKQRIREQVAQAKETADEQLNEAMTESFDAYQDREKSKGFGRRMLDSLKGATMDPASQTTITTQDQFRGGNDADMIHKVQVAEAAQRSIKNAEQMIAEADRTVQNGKSIRNFFSGGFRGFGQNAFRPENWDMGVSDMSEMAAISTALDKADKGRALTPEEKSLLDAKALEMATQMYFGSDLSRGYKAGQVTAESLPFMLEMMINPASTVGDMAVNKLTRYALKEFGGKAAVDAAVTAGTEAATAAATKAGRKVAEEAVEKAVENEIADAARKAAAAKGKQALAKYTAEKVGARVAGDLAGSALMTVTSGAVGTAADALDRMNGTIQYGEDENGNIVYNGHEDGESTWKAISKAIGARTIENYSEMVGEYFDPILAQAGKGLSKVAASSFGKAIKLDTVADFIENVSGSDFGRAFNHFLDRTKWNGPIGEFAEEVAGSIMNALFVGDEEFNKYAYKYKTDENGDYILDKDGNKIVETDADGNKIFQLDENGEKVKNENYVFDKDKMIDTFLGVGLMGGFTSAFKTVGYVGASHYTNRKLKKADAVGSAAMGDEKWKEFTDNVDSADKTGTLAEYAQSVFSDPNLNRDTKKLEIEYLAAFTQYKGAHAGKAKKAEDPTQDPFRADLESSYDAGTELVTDEQRNDAKNQLDYATQELMDVTGMDYIGEEQAIININSPQASPEAKRAMINYLNARATYEGMIDTVKDDIDSRVIAAEATVDSNTNKETGNIQPATLKEGSRNVYIVAGSLATNEDGTIDHARSSESIVVRDAETGKLEMMSPEAVQSAGQAIDPAQEKAAARRQIQQEIAAPAAAQIDGQLSFTPGETITIDDEQGEVPIRIGDSYIGEDGVEWVNVDIDYGDGVASLTAYPRSYIQEGYTRRQQRRLQEANAQRAQADAQTAAAIEAEVEKQQAALQEGDVVRFEKDGMPLEGTAVTGEDGQARIQVTDDAGNTEEMDVAPEEITMINGEIPESNLEWDDEEGGIDLTREEPAPAAPVEQAPVQQTAPVQETQAAEQTQATEEKPAETAAPAETAQAPEGSALARIPVGEDGQAQFEQAPVKDTWDALVELNEGDTAEAEDTAKQMIDIAAKELETAQKAKVQPGANVMEIQKAKAEHKKAIADAQAKLDYWNNVLNTKNAAQAIKKAQEKVAEQMAAEAAEKAAEAAATPEVAQETAPAVEEPVATPEGSKVEGSREEQVVETARQQVETNPTEAQKKAGNYKMGHVTIDGHNVTIENPRGSVRSGRDAEGREWRTEMHNDYGYIRGTRSVDGDHIDVFLSDNPTEGQVFVVDQVDPKTGKFDEHKVMYGFKSVEEAKQAYLSNYEKGWQGLGAITPVSKERFKKWIDSSTRKTKPFSEYAGVQTPAQAEQERAEKAARLAATIEQASAAIGMSADESMALPKRLQAAYESGNAKEAAAVEKQMTDYLAAIEDAGPIEATMRAAKYGMDKVLGKTKGDARKALKESPEYKRYQFVQKSTAKRLKELQKAGKVKFSQVKRTFQEMFDGIEEMLKANLSPADRAELMSQKAAIIQDYLSTFGKPVKVITAATVADDLRAEGASENFVGQAVEGIRNYKVFGFTVPAMDKAFVVADNIWDLDHAYRKMQHELQHIETKDEQIKEVAGSTTRRGLLNAAALLNEGKPGVYGYNGYEGFGNAALADEILSMAKELAYVVPAGKYADVLRQLGLDEKLVNTLTKYFNEQTIDQSLIPAGRISNERSSTRGGHEGVRQADERRAGEVERQGDSLSKPGVSQPASRKSRNTGLTREQSDEIAAEVGGSIEVLGRKTPVRFSATAQATGAGFTLSTDLEGKKSVGDVYMTDANGKRYDSKNHITGQDIKDNDCAFNYMIQDAIQSGTISEKKADRLYKNYAKMLNAMLDKGVEKDGISGYDRLSSTWTWKASTAYRAVADNSDKQYSYSIDITRVCKKNEAVIKAISIMQRRLGYGITPGQIMDIYLSSIEEGFQVPCPVCYVFSRYIDNGKVASMAINGKRLYIDNGIDIVMGGKTVHVPALADPRKISKEEYDARVKFWEEEYDKQVANDEKNAKAIAKAKSVIKYAMKTIDNLSREITTSLALKEKGLEPTLTQEQIDQKKAEVDALDKDYRTALNVVAHANLKSWIKCMAIHKVGGKNVLWTDTFQGFPDEHALDLRLTDETMRKYPGVQRLRKSLGSAGGKEIHFEADNTVGDVISMVGTDLKKAVNWYEKAAKETDPKKKAAYIKKATNRYNSARIYALRQSLRGGQRMWSWSDNIERLAPDVWMNIMQMELLGGAIQSYSKQLEGINLVARMGAYVNGSLMGRGIGYTEVKADEVQDGKYIGQDITETDKDGKKHILTQTGAPVFQTKDGKYYTLVFDDVVGIDAFGNKETGKKGLFDLNAELDKAGNILVGMNDLHIEAAMADDRVYFIIPWHSSGMSMHILNQMLEYLGTSLSDRAQDYTSVQEEKPAIGAKKTDEEKEVTGEDEEVTTNAAGKEIINPRLQEFWDAHTYEDKFKSGLGHIPSGTEDGQLHPLQVRYKYLRDAILNGVKVEYTDSKGRKRRKTVNVDSAEAQQQDPEMMKQIQADEFLKQVYESVKDRVGDRRMTSTDTGFIYPYEYWDKSTTYGTADVNGQRYLEYCRRLGYKPKFVGTLKGDPAKEFGNFADSRGYWKLLIDRRMYDVNGKYQDLDPADTEEFDPKLADPEYTETQFDVTTVATDEGNDKIVDRAIQKGEDRMGDTPTVDYSLSQDEAVKAFSEVEKRPEIQAARKSGDITWSRVTPEVDKEYMDAVNAGDMDKAQEMVKAAFKAAFPDTKVVDEKGEPMVVFHGTMNGGFNTFDPRKGASHFGKYKFGQNLISYFTTDKQSADSYKDHRPTGKTYEVMLNMQNPFVVKNESDANSKTSFNIKDQALRKFELDMFNKFRRKWNGREVDFDFDEEELNADLMPFNLEARNEDGYITIFYLGNNSLYGGEREIASFKNNDVIGDWAMEDLADRVIGEEEDDYFYSTDRVAKLVLAMSEESGKSYDGIVIPQILDSASMFSGYGTDYITFAPSQIKSADPVTYDDNGEIIPLSKRFTRSNDIRFSRANESQRIFISNAEQAVESINMGKATGENWLKAIQGKGGLKAGEDKWLGLSQWLQEQQGPVTKDDVLKFIQENQIQIEEVKYNENPSLTGYEGLDKLNDEFQDLLDKNSGEDDPMESAMSEMERKYGESFWTGFYIGGEGEVIMNRTAFYLNEEAEAFYGQYGVTPRYDKNPIDGTRLYYTTHYLENKREVALTVPTIEPYNEFDDIHFGDAGNGRAVAWIRFGETKAGDGRVLVIDEIQSKRHQDGRERGYAEDKLSAAGLHVVYSDSGLSRFADKDGNLMARMEREVGTTDALFNAKYVKPTPEQQAAIDEQRRENGLMTIGLEVKRKKVPAAPFEKNWHELAMKRMLRLAAEEGFDKIAWTNGTMQAKRYKMIGRADEIYLGKRKDGKYGMTIYDKESMPIKHPKELVGYDGIEDLSKVLGIEIATELVQGYEQMPEDKKAAHMPFHINGGGMEIGGEGMKGFYDDILPRFMNKYGKRWGVKVQNLSLPNLVDNEDGWHSIDVTPEMKESVMRGQVMFSRATADVSTVDVPGEDTTGLEIGVENPEVKFSKTSDDMREIATDPTAIDNYFNGLMKTFARVKDKDILKRVNDDAMQNDLEFEEAVARELASYAISGEVTNGEERFLADAVGYNFGWQSFNNDERKYLAWKAYTNEGGAMGVADDVVMQRELGIGDFKGLKDIKNNRTAEHQKEVNAIKRKAKKDGTYLLAPNGKKSNLPEGIWETVRTKAFLNWFGDWINDPENASQVVDENGEPKIYFHGTQYYGFYQFDTQEKDINTNLGSHFGTADAASTFDSRGNKTYRVFLNLRNPLRMEDMFAGDQLEQAAMARDMARELGTPEADDMIARLEEIAPGLDRIDSYDDYWDYRESEDWEENLGMDEETQNEIGKILRQVIEQSGYDGVVYDNAMEDAGNDSYIAFHPSQIKAIENNGDFDPGKGDIRFSRVTPAQDEAFRKAYESGDVETATRMVKDAFKAAYPDTKVVDENGEPKVVYHGTKSKFTVFDPSRIGSNTGNRGFYGPGFYFADSENVAGQYGGRVIPAYLNITSPNMIEDWERNLGKYIPLEDKGLPEGYTLQDWNKEHDELMSRPIKYTVRDGWSINFINVDVYDESGSYIGTLENMSKMLKDNPTELENAVKYGIANSILMEKYSLDKVPSVLLRDIPSADLSKMFLNEGNDGIIGGATNFWDVGNEYVVFAPSQIKSAEPFTFDDQGELIPLSKRFSESPDIRFSRTQDTIDESMDKAAAATERAGQARKSRLTNLAASFAEIRRAAAAQRAYDRATVKAVTDLAQELLNEGEIANLNRAETESLMIAAREATGRRDVTKQVDRLMDVLINNRLRNLKNQLVQILKVRGDKVDARGIQVMGKLDVHGQRIAKAFNGAFNLERAQIEGLLADAMDRMGDDNVVIAENAADEYEGLQIALQFYDQVKQTVIDVKMIQDDLENAKLEHQAGRMSDTAYREFVKSCEEAKRQARLDRIDGYTNIINAMLGQYTKSFDQVKAFREAEAERIGSIHHFANSDMAGMDTSAQGDKNSRFANNALVRFFFKPLATFDQMLRSFAKSTVNGEGYLWNHFMRGWNKANNEEFKGFQAATKILDDKVSEVFGKKKMMWRDLYEVEKKMPTVEITHHDGGAEVTREYTQGNLLYIYMANKMADGRMKLRNMGITEEDVAAIVRQMDPRFLELADWLQDEFLVQQREKYNQVYEKIMGASMDAIDNYFPLRIAKEGRVQQQDLSQDTGNNPSTITGALKKRVRNSAALDLQADAFSVVIEHIQEMEHWAAFAPLTRDLNTLLSYKTFRNKVRNQSSIYGAGDTYLENFKTCAAIAVGAYKSPVGRDGIDKVAVNLAKGVTGAKIAFRVYTAIKQLLSMPAFLADANTGLLAKSLATPRRSWKWAMENLPAFEKRFKSRQLGDTVLMDTDSDWKSWKNKIVETASRLGMTPNAFVDALTVAVGAKAMYDTKYKSYIKAGYSQAEAERRAKDDASFLFNETQQSNESAFVSPMQVERTWLSTALTVFRNSSMGYERQFVDAIRNLSRMTKPGFKEESIAFMTKQMVRDGVAPDVAAAAAERVYKRAAFKNATRVATFGFLMQIAWNLGAYLPYLLCGGDGDEKEKMLKDALTHGLFGPLEGLTGGNLISEASNMVASGRGLANYNPTLMPIVSDTKKIIQMMSTDQAAAAAEILNLAVQAGVGVNPQTLTDICMAFYDASKGDLGLAREMGLCLARVLQVPQSQTEKFYIDGIDLTAEHGLDFTIDQFAQRYADYKVKRSVDGMGFLYPDDVFEKKVASQAKKFSRKVEERRRTSGTPTDQAWYEYVDSEYKTTKKTISDLQKAVKEAGKAGDTQGAMEYAEQLHDFMESEEFKRYARLKGYVEAETRLKNALKTADPTSRTNIEDAINEVREKMVETLEQTRNE